MKPTHLLASLLLASAALPPIVCAADAPPFEEPPTLRAGDILRPEYMAGPHHRVREAVPTYAGANWFTIDSDFGVFEAEGNALLEQRVAEIYAIAQLKDVSRGEQYAKALASAAKSPLLAAKSLITQPAKTVSAVPKGVFKMFSRAGQGLGDAKQQRERSAYEDKRANELLGVSKAKREIAAKLGIDPHSSNEVLQRELNSLAWASFAGQTTFTLATMPISGGAGAALTATGVVDRNQDRLRELTPADIRRDSLAQLTKMGIPKDGASAFLNNPAFSPWHQIRLVRAFKFLDGVKGWPAYLRLAAEVAEDENDAIFFEQTADLIARIHVHIAPLDRIIIHDVFPVCIAKDGTVVVAFQWDYAAWTPMSERFISEMEKLAKQQGAGIRVALTGQISPTLREQLAARGIRVDVKVLPGPLK